MFTRYRSLLGEGNGTPLQHSCLENPMDRGAWKAAVHGVAEGRTRLSNFTFTFHFHTLEKEMATHSSVLAWRIPGKAEPDGLPSPSPMHESEKWKWSHSVMSDSLATPWTAAHQAPPSMGFSRQECWSGVPLPSPSRIWYILITVPMHFLHRLPKNNYVFLFNITMALLA